MISDQFKLMAALGLFSMFNMHTYCFSRHSYAQTWCFQRSSPSLGSYYIYILLSWTVQARCNNPHHFTTI